MQTVLGLNVEGVGSLGREAKRMKFDPDRVAAERRKREHVLEQMSRMFPYLKLLDYGAVGNEHQTSKPLP